MNPKPPTIALLAGTLLAVQSPAVTLAQTSTFSVEEATISDLHAAYLAGRTTTRAVIQAHLDRIAAYDKRGPVINSLITVNARALEDADRLDAALRASGRLTGPLHGIAIVVKDNIDVAGMPMTSGFQGWKNYHPPEDAPLVKRLRAAGAIILAKASLSEFTRGIGDNINSVLPGFARNPYNTAFATGGSSGGTGASVAASFAVVGIGTDTGGSVRAPAAHNALAGLRPTVGLVTTAGMTPNNSVRDTTGPMARGVRDMTILLDVIAGPDPEDPVTARADGHRLTTYTGQLKPDALKGARLGVLRQVFGPQVTDPRILAHFEKTIAELKAAGAEIVDPFVVPGFEVHAAPARRLAGRPLQGRPHQMVRQTPGRAVRVGQGDCRFQAGPSAAPGVVRRGGSREAGGRRSGYDRRPQEREALPGGLSGSDGHRAGRRADLPELDAASRH